MRISEYIEQVGLRVPILRSYFYARQFRWRWSRYVPPGHFYSPIPSDEDIKRWKKSRNQTDRYLGVELRIDEQKSFVKFLVDSSPEMPFRAQRAGSQRYYFDNAFFSYADATFLYLIMRHLKPRQIVEVGSGFSSSLMLDVVELCPDVNSKITLIEPNTGRLQELLRPEDSERCRIIELPVQDVDPQIFTGLECGDILFIDSSHVVKAGSDVKFLVFDVLPRLAPGVWIHIHDIFPDFDYPEEWLDAGRSWNEAYIIRAFLMFNEAFEVILHGPTCIDQYPIWFKANLPHCLENPGGSLWIRRKLFRKP